MLIERYELFGDFYRAVNFTFVVPIVRIHRLDLEYRLGLGLGLIRVGFDEIVHGSRGRVRVRGSGRVMGRVRVRHLPMVVPPSPDLNPKVISATHHFNPH